MLCIRRSNVSDQERTSSMESLERRIEGFRVVFHRDHKENKEIHSVRYETEEKLKVNESSNKQKKSVDNKC